MNNFLLIPLAGAILSFALGNVVLYLNRKRTINILFMLICVVTSYHSLTELLCRLAGSHSTALFWAKTGSFWYLAIGFSLHFILLFSEKNKLLSSKPAYLTIYGPAVLFSFLELFTDTLIQNVSHGPFGYTPVYVNNSIPAITVSLFMAFAGLSVFGISFHYFLHLHDKRKKKQAMYISAGFFMPIVAGAIVHGIPFMNDFNTAPGNSAAIVVQCLLTGYAIWKYKLFTIDPTTAAENIIAIMPDSFVLVDCRMRVLSVNKSLSRLLGYSGNELKGKPCSLFLKEGDTTAKTCERMFLEGAIQSFEADFITKDGATIPVSVSANALLNEKNEPAGIVMVARDMREIKRIQSSLEEEKERLAVTLRCIGDGVIAADIDGNIVFINKVAETLTGWNHEEAAGMKVDDVFHIIDGETREKRASPVKEVLATGASIILGDNTLLIGRNGAERVIADSGAPIRDKNSKIIGAVLVFRDITEKSRLEAETIRAQKLESIGVLAGGIAHDFNNILVGITSNLSIVKNCLKAGDEVTVMIAEMEEAALQAKALTGQLLTFAKGGSPVKKTTDIAKLIEDTGNFVLRGSSMKAEFDLPDGLWLADVDRQQIGQVVSNIIINAVQAMPGSGVLKVCAENVPAGSSPPPGAGEDCPYVKIAISDTGVGIPKEHIGRIFDPYFTTKQKGNGLGLASSYSIIKNHKGHISVESEVGKGTTFSIYLPASCGAVPDINGKTGGVMGGKGKILLMDDEELVRKVMARILSHLGYTVEFSVDGADAIDKYTRAKESGAPFNAVIMDLTIPGGMGGKEALAKLRELDPGAKVIVSSGYSTDQVMSSHKSHGFDGVLTKPFTLDEVSTTLRDVLNND